MPLSSRSDEEGLQRGGGTPFSAGLAVAVVVVAGRGGGAEERGGAMGRRQRGTGAGLVPLTLSTALHFSASSYLPRACRARRASHREREPESSARSRSARAACVACAPGPGYCAQRAATRVPQLHAQRESEAADRASLNPADRSSSPNLSSAPLSSSSQQKPGPARAAVHKVPHASCAPCLRAPRARAPTRSRSSQCCVNLSSTSASRAARGASPGAIRSAYLHLSPGSRCAASSRPASRLLHRR